MLRIKMMLLTVRNGRISCILEARMTAAAAAKLMIDLSAGRSGRPSGGKSARGVKWVHQHVIRKYLGYTK